MDGEAPGSSWMGHKHEGLRAHFLSESDDFRVYLGVKYELD